VRFELESTEYSCIENDSVLLRGLKDSDLDRLVKMREESVVYRYEPTFLAELQGSPSQALSEIRAMDLKKDGQFIWGVFDKSDPDTLAGLAELYDYKPSGKVISVGYRLMPEYWGRGMATGSVRALQDFIQRCTRVELITAHAIPDNIASIRCLLRNGFEYLLTKTEDWGRKTPTVAEVYTCDVIRRHLQDGFEATRPVGTHL
jgi:ribosomal-protein-alanine N-acetyltransferase